MTTGMLGSLEPSALVKGHIGVVALEGDSYVTSHKPRAASYFALSFGQLNIL